tara:strand:+ start:3296 stop:3622 length:327 start_codon:yes stop_codon:yes gene_type:complete
MSAPNGYLLRGKVQPQGRGKLRGPDGKYLNVGGTAVMAVEEYNGWQIMYHAGRYQARRTIDGGAVVETPAVPFLWQARRRADWFNKHAKENYGIDGRAPRGEGIIVKP